ncbi:MAG: GNAT family N-acetyltransferase [Nitrososphaerota archaeon]|nr:GNAT family N-acetyltransferase [Nitrososphaerota archaeon]
MGESKQIRVRLAIPSDIPYIAEIGCEAFSGLRPLECGMRWVEACFAAHPRMEYWVAEMGTESTAAGYILWLEKGGFRKDAVLELEQIAVRKAMRGTGIGRELVVQSLQGVKSRLQARGSELSVIEITTGSEQRAVGFYRRTLGANPVATIPSLFRGDELVLLARPRLDQGKQV